MTRVLKHILAAVLVLLGLACFYALLTFLPLSSIGGKASLALGILLLVAGALAWKSKP
ncbi:MAG: hypothetical protein JNM86_11720 [Phycisphaerae bacterium]|nr:hypothetical protein [Phycisphaerae bacterium]